MTNINWNVSKEDDELITKIVDRAEGLGYCEDRTSLTMDLIATHLNGTPLNLEKLLKADGFNFAHDIGGIRGHINRETGKLERCFLPRCAR